MLEYIIITPNRDNLGSFDTLEAALLVARSLPTEWFIVSCPNIQCVAYPIDGRGIR